MISSSLFSPMAAAYSGTFQEAATALTRVENLYVLHPNLSNRKNKPQQEKTARSGEARPPG
jgi:hypothetical protein